MPPSPDLIKSPAVELACRIVRSQVGEPWAVVRVTSEGSGTRAMFSGGVAVMIPTVVLEWLQGWKGSLAAFLDTERGQRATLIVRGSLVRSSARFVEPDMGPVKRRPRRQRGAK